MRPHEAQVSVTCDRGGGGTCIGSRSNEPDPHDGQLRGDPLRSVAMRWRAWAGLYVAGRGLRIKSSLSDSSPYTAGSATGRFRHPVQLHPCQSLGAQIVRPVKPHASDRSNRPSRRNVAWSAPSTLSTRGVDEVLCRRVWGKSTRQAEAPFTGSGRSNRRRRSRPRRRSQAPGRGRKRHRPGSRSSRS